jgi:hypothetical protein
VKPVFAVDNTGMCIFQVPLNHRGLTGIFADTPLINIVFDADLAVL